MYGFANIGTTTRKSAFDFKDLLNPAFSQSQTTAVSPLALSYPNLAALANLAGLGHLLRGDSIAATTASTTTKSAGFDLGSLFGSATGTSTSSGASSNTLLSLLSLLSGTSGVGSLASIMPLLNILPLDQLLSNNNPQANLGLITSLPQILSLIQSFNNFKFPVSNVRNVVFFVLICIKVINYSIRTIF